MGENVKKILYVHYQKNASEGSTVHVARFSSAFSRICEEQRIEFEVVAPEKIFFTPDQQRKSLFSRAKQWLAKYYLREIKVVLRQIINAYHERKMLLHKKPDVVVTRYDAETLSIHWACRSLGIPVLTEFNGRDRQELAGTYLDYKQLALVNRLFGNCNALNFSVGAMAVSDEIADDLKKCNNSGKPVIVNHNGVDLDEFDPEMRCEDLRQQWDIPENGLVVGYIGSFIIWHSPERLFSAFERLIATGVDAYLLLVGPKLPEISAMIETCSPELAQRVRYVGFVKHENIPSYLALMDIAVLPNTQAYCSPLKLFEYMAMAKACLVPATSTIQSILVDGEEGMLFNPASEEAFIQGLLRLAHDEALRQKIGQAARKRVEAEFTWDHNAERVMQLIHNGLAWKQRN